MKRIIPFILIASVLLCATGCGNAGDSASTPTPPTSTPAPPTPTPAITVDPKRVADPVTPAKDFAGGSGTEDDPYLISSAEELALLGRYIHENTTDHRKAWYRQTNDIIINDTADFSSWDTTAPARSWLPVAWYSACEFCGHYDGGGYSVKGLYIYTPGATESLSAAGLFGYVSGGTITNLHMEKAYIYTEGVVDAGTVVGSCRLNATVSDCSSNAVLHCPDSSDLGGIVGHIGSGTTVTNCKTAGEYRGSTVYGNAVGGIVGNAYSGTVSHCVNSATLSGYDVGGIVGTGGTLIRDCRNTAAITAENYAAGIVSTHCDAVENCINSGSVEVILDYAYAGGIVAYHSGTVRSCENTGNVVALDKVCAAGGIAGSIGCVEDIPRGLADCHNSGSVEVGKDGAAGGLVGVLLGHSDSEYTSSSNSGSIICHEGDLGGLIGRTNVSKAVIKIEDCTNTGHLSCSNCPSSYIGGLIGNASCSDNGELSFIDCRNEAPIINGGGFCSSVTTSAGDLSFIRCVNAGEIQDDDVAAAGGISMLAVGDGQVLFEDCINLGNVSGNVVNMGGIVGDVIVFAEKKSSTLRFTGCRNEGALSADVDGTNIIMGGIIGELYGGSSQVIIENCSNLASIHLETGENTSTEDYRSLLPLFPTALGGIIGSTDRLVQNCTNTGDISINGNGAPTAFVGEMEGMVLGNDKL